MTTPTNTQKNAGGVCNIAQGRVITQATTAAAQTFTLGFKPRIVRFHNVTDRISDEWYEGMHEAQFYTGFAAVTAILDADAGITATNFGSLWNPTEVEANVTNFHAALVGLAAKLDADPDVVTTTYSAQIPNFGVNGPTLDQLRTSLTAIAGLLDADTGVTSTTYTAACPGNSTSLHTVANGTRTLELTNGIAVDGYTFTVTATTLAASKVFFWEAIG